MDSKSSLSNPTTTGEQATRELDGWGFDIKYHACNNPGASKRDRFKPCRICGWASHMAIHDKDNLGSMDGYWAHPYEPK